MKKNRISLVTAASNEAKTLLKLIELSTPFVDEIIVVDDASTDGTEEILKGLPIVYIKNEINLNQEQSIEKGLKAATGDIIVTIDSDLEHDPRDIPTLVEYLTTHDIDIVIGSRKVLPRISEQNVSEFTKEKFNLEDPFCSFRAFYRYVYEQIGWFHKHDYYGIDFNIEAARKFKLDNMAITHVDARGDARIGTMDEVDKKLNAVLEYLKVTYKPIANIAN
jgi:glycosyltransferase involved in cell wall biosynthesis